MKSILPKVVFAASAFLLPIGEASAALVGNIIVNGRVKNSNDGASSNDSVISASTEAGSTVLAAFLYSHMFLGGTAPTTTLAGNPLDFTPLGFTAGRQAWRADVTSIVAPAIDGGPGGVVDFAYEEGVTSGSNDGSALVVVYSNPSLPQASVAVLDGFSETTGDQFVATFAAPLDPTSPGFFAELSLGIGFGFNDDSNPAGSGQQSDVLVNGEILTEAAGSFDDGFAANGGLITVGGFDDAIVTSPPATIGEDTERYDISGFIEIGDTEIVIDTLNPSNDDNIFLATIYTSARASSVINPDDPDPVDPIDVNPIPLPAAGWMMLAGMAGLFGFGRTRGREA
jgi:hypothetical protein